MSYERLQANDPANLPDIYYIILDAYAREDVMQEDVGYDNSSFYNFLEERQFYVPDRSNSNHYWTSLSLASSLNMVYAQDLGLDLERGTYPAIFSEPIQHSRARNLLEDLGYSIVAIRTGYTTTEITDADIFLQPEIEELEKIRKPLTLNAFEGMLFHSSALRIIADFEQSLQAHLIHIAGQREYQTVVSRWKQHSYDVLREIILTQFDELASSQDIPGPKFVFTHIVSPHRPYIFGPDGENLTQIGPYTLALDEDTNKFDVDKYRDQAIYITMKIEVVLDEIITNSDHPPIIILQSDHGPGLTSDWRRPESEGIWHRTAILNAYLLPEDCKPLLYPTITPVNTFRIVFNCISDAEFPLLEDNVFFSRHPRFYEYEFINVNDRIK